jgi:hypothetical protein
VSFNLLDDLGSDAGTSRDLALLAGLLADGRLDSHIELELPWMEWSRGTTALLERRIAGKAVLLVE